MLRTLVVLLCLLFTSNAFAQKGKTNEKKNDPQIDYKVLGTPMPVVRLAVYPDTGKHPEVKSGRKKHKRSSENIDSDSVIILTNKDLDNGANLFIMLFNPTCSHCEDETAMLEKNIDKFKKSRLLLMATPVQYPYVGDFVSMLKVHNYPQITVGVDSSAFINEVFLYQALPQINIYDADRKLIRIFTGEVSIDSLEKYIQ